MSVERGQEPEGDFDWGWAEHDEGAWVPPEVRINVPAVARIHDCLLGGKDNSAVDRAAAAQVRVAMPGADDQAQAGRAFLERAVAFLAGQGIDQFIDLGSGLPTAPTVHEVARRFVPDARVVYVDHDPIVLSYNRALLATDDNLVTVMEDLRDPEAVLEHPAVAGLIDFGRPVGLLMAAVIHFVRHDVASGVIKRYRRAVSRGSALVVSAACGDRMRPEDVSRLEAVYARTASPFVARTAVQLDQLFEGFSLVEPGLADPAEWRPEIPSRPVPVGTATVGLAGVGLKP